MDTHEADQLERSHPPQAGPRTPRTPGTPGTQRSPGTQRAPRTQRSPSLMQLQREKLQISKELLEQEVEHNKMRQRFQEEALGLKKEILIKEGLIVDLEVDRDQLVLDLQASLVRLRSAEQFSKDLQEENASLKRNHQVLVQAQQRKLTQSQEQETETDKLQQQTLEQKVVAMDTEQRELRRTILQKQKEQSEQSAALQCSELQLTEAQKENSELQLQVKELNEEYRARLERYLHDIAVYVDRRGAGARAQARSEAGSVGQSKARSKAPPEVGSGDRMGAFVESMLLEVRSTFRAREEQLAGAARFYKKRLQRTTQTHNALLIAYRVQRDQILARPECGLDAGFPESHFSLEASELQGALQKEVQQLREPKAKVEA